jgi:hypothetical protein
LRWAVVVSDTEVDCWLWAFAVALPVAVSGFADALAVSVFVANVSVFGDVAAVSAFADEISVTGDVGVPDATLDTTLDTGPVCDETAGA